MFFKSQSNADYVPLTITEWLETVPDCHNSQLFTKNNGINSTTLGLQTLNTNFAIAMIWARNRIVHISRVLHINDLDYVFQESIECRLRDEKREPPTKPEINLYKPKINPIPKAINRVQRPPNDTQSKSKLVEVDNQTTATCNTALSSDNEISDLQSTSRNQMSANHDMRMKQLELILQNSIDDNLEQITNVSHKIQQIEKSNDFLQEEMETIMNTLPRLSTSLQSQNNQLQRTIEDNTDFCRITFESISALQTLQNSTDNRLDHVHSILNKLVNKSTPSSSGKNRKKSKSTNQS
jgi:hypothetical protein